MVFNYICSLGPACATAGFIKMNQLKSCSYPFDWVFSSLDIVKDCLNDDFYTFLKKKYYRPILNETDKCGHKKYGEKMFQHRNPYGKEEDYQYYVRCVERFRKLLNTSESKLFTMVFINYCKSKISELKKNIIKFNIYLRNYTTNYNLCIIIQMVDLKNYHRFSVENITDDIQLLYVYTKGDYKLWGKGKNRCDTDYVNKVFTDLYKFDLSCE